MEFEFCDAHMHFVPAFKAADFCFPLKYHFCTCAHSVEEFLEQEKLLSGNSDPSFHIIRAFGLHPQMPLLENAAFLRRLLEEQKIGAVGEAGFDFFTQEFIKKSLEQEEAWKLQLGLANEYGLPLVVHCRKAVHKIFEYLPELKALRAVVFHSFSGTLRDAVSILEHGVNAYFSFGKPLLNGAKKAVMCVKKLPPERLIFETDSPFQTLKGEISTPAGDIEEVYQCAWELRCTEAFMHSEKKQSFKEFCSVIKENFCSVFQN